MFAAVFVLLLAAHWTSDYPGQTDHQAEHKAERTMVGWAANITHATTHVAVSAVLVAIGALLLDEVVLHPLPMVLALLWIGLSHSFIDRRWPVERWMAATGQSSFKAAGGAVHVDQAGHVLLGILPASLVLTTCG